MVLLQRLAGNGAVQSWLQGARAAVQREVSAPQFSGLKFKGWHESKFEPGAYRIDGLRDTWWVVSQGVLSNVMGIRRGYDPRNGIVYANGKPVAPSYAVPASGKQSR